MKTDQQPQLVPSAAKAGRVIKAGGEARVQIILLGRQASGENAISLVRSGLPLSSIARVRKKLKFNESAVLSLMGMSKETYQQRQEARENLSPIESDRLYRLARIEAHATDVFEDEEIAADWLKQPNRALGDKPIDLLDTDAGTDRVDRLLTRIEYGVYS
jgi:putative toxin-antitoxin system antitoxin component (TIGR02293 family)